MFFYCQTENFTTFFWISSKRKTKWEYCICSSYFSFSIFFFLTLCLYFWGYISFFCILVLITVIQQTVMFTSLNCFLSCIFVYSSFCFINIHEYLVRVLFTQWIQLYTAIFTWSNINNYISAFCMTIYHLNQHFNVCSLTMSLWLTFVSNAS